MSEYLEKKIDTNAEFIQAIVRHNIYIDDDTPEVNQLVDLFDDATINPAWLAAITGTGSITEANDKLNIASNATAIVYLCYGTNWYLPATFNILVKFAVNTAGDATTLKVATVAYSRDNVWVTTDGSNLYIKYTATDGTTVRWWDGAAWQLTTQALTMGSYVRIKKTSSKYYIKTYDANYALIDSAEIAISSVWQDQWERFFSGSQVAAATAFDIDLYFIAGIINDKIALGRFTNLIDLGQAPIIPGQYSDAIANDILMDATNPQYLVSTGYTLRNTANTTKISQGFKLTASGIIDKVKLYMQQGGSITAGQKVWVEIWTDDGTGKPSALITGCVSAKKEASTIQSSTTETVEFIFNSPVILAKNTQYHIVVVGDFTIGGAGNLYLNFDSPGVYANGAPHDFNGSVWGNVVVSASADMIFGVKLKSSSLITRYISYSDWNASQTIDSKADWEGHNQYKLNMETISKPGFVILDKTGGLYYSNGVIRNDIDLGQVPTNPCTLSLVQYLPEGTVNYVYISYCDDGVSYVSPVLITVTNGNADLSSFGLHRYWRVNMNVHANGAKTLSPEIDSWTIDAYGPQEELTERTKIKAYQYLKIEINLDSEAYSESAELTYLQAQYRINYELYIKRVKYKISAQGIIADMELSNK